jgi:hypothetical protein
MSLDFSLSEAFGFDFEGEDPDFSIRDFTLGGETDGIENERYLQPRIYESIAQKVKFEHACDLIDGLKLEPGFRMFAFVSGNFVFGDVIEALVTTLGIQIKRMTIQTLSMSQENIDSLRNVIDNCFELESLRLVVSDYFYSHERNANGLVPYIYERLDVDDVLDVAFAGVHTKITTIETINGLKIVMDGSANLRSSRNVEQFRIECDADLYDYIERFADRIFDAYSVINKDAPRPKSIRAKRLWQKVGTEEDDG